MTGAEYFVVSDDVVLRGKKAGKQEIREVDEEEYKDIVSGNKGGDVYPRRNRPPSRSVSHKDWDAVCQYYKERRDDIADRNIPCGSAEPFAYC